LSSPLNEKTPHHAVQPICLSCDQIDWGNILPEIFF
jgi:hypothetical protein